MTSEQNISSYSNYSNFQTNVYNSNQLNNRLPNRKPTEGEIDQFIELLKNSNTGNEVLNDVNNSNTRQINNQYKVTDLKVDKSLDEWKQEDVTTRCLLSEANTRVTFNTDGSLMKTIHIQSPESYLREAERFDKDLRKERDLEDDKHSKSDGGNSVSSNDYLRKTTYRNKNSELKVTISCDQEKSFGYIQDSMDRAMSSRGDIDSRFMASDMMYSNRSMSITESYSRSSGYIQEKERYPDEFGGSRSYSRYPEESYPRDIDLRFCSPRSPALNSQRRKNLGDRRSSRDTSPSFPYTESMRLKDRSPYQNRQYGSHYGSSYGRDIPINEGYSSSRSHWSRSRTPSPKRRRNSMNRDVYNLQKEDSFSDFDERKDSPEFKDRRDDKRYGRKNSSLYGVPSPPSPPPPPVLSDLKKKKPSKYRSEYEHSKPKKMDQNTSINPISTLLADRNVSISTLLEAAIGTSGGKISSYTPWDAAKKLEIVSNCEEKLGQLYRHRVSGPGSFIPDSVPPPTPSYLYKSPLITHFPRLEFNNRTINNIWHCPDVVVPDPTYYKSDSYDKGENVICVTDDDDVDGKPFSNSRDYKSRKESIKKNDDERKTRTDNDEMTGPRIETRVSYATTARPFKANISSEGTTMLYGNEQQQHIQNTVLEDYNRSLQWQQYGTGPQYTDGDPSYNVPPNFQHAPYGPPETFDSMNWSGPPVGYHQQNFENQQLVQYPVGYQPIGPSSQSTNNNTGYPLRQTVNNPIVHGDNSQFPPGPQDSMVQYPIGFPNTTRPNRPNKWFLKDKQNMHFPGTPMETVQYPLKQRSNMAGGNDSKTSQSKNNSVHNSNLISLTGNVHLKRKSDDPLVSQKASSLNSNDENKNESNKKSRFPNDPEEIKDNKEENMEKTDYPPLQLDKSLMKKLLEVNSQVRNIQLNDDKSNFIIKDLESGPKVYSYAYCVNNLMLLKKDRNDYRIYVSEIVENSMLNLFHGIFHDESEIELEVIIKRILTNIQDVHEKISHVFHSCSLCRRNVGKKVNLNRDHGRASSPNRIAVRSPGRKSRSPRRRNSRSPLRAGPGPRLRSLSPSKRRKGYYRSPPPKKIPPKVAESSKNSSKDRGDVGHTPGRNRSGSRGKSFKRTRSSRSRDRRGRSRGRSRPRGSSTLDKNRSSSKSRRGRSGRSPRREPNDNKKVKRTPEVEIVPLVKTPITKETDTIDLTDEMTDETNGKDVSKNEQIAKTDNQKTGIRIVFKKNFDLLGNEIKHEVIRDDEENVPHQENKHSKLDLENKTQKDTAEKAMDKHDQAQKVEAVKEIQKQDNEISKDSTEKQKTDKIQKESAEKERDKQDSKKQNDNTEKQETDKVQKESVEKERDKQDSKKQNDNTEKQKTDKVQKESAEKERVKQDSKKQNDNTEKQKIDKLQKESAEKERDKQDSKKQNNNTEKQIKDKVQKESAEKEIDKQDSKIQKDSIEKQTKDKVQKENAEKEMDKQDSKIQKDITEKQTKDKERKESVEKEMDKQDGKIQKDSTEKQAKDKIQKESAEKGMDKQDSKIQKEAPEKIKQSNEQKQDKDPKEKSEVSTTEQKNDKRIQKETTDEAQKLKHIAEQKRENEKQKETTDRKHEQNIYEKKQSNVKNQKEQQDEQNFSKEEYRKKTDKETTNEVQKQSTAQQIQDKKVEKETIDNTQKQTNKTENQGVTKKREELANAQKEENNVQKDKISASVEKGEKKVQTEKTNVEKQENKEPSKLDFKSRIRNIQLENCELKSIIENLESNNDNNKKTIDTSYLMKGGMLCKRCQVGSNNEVRIMVVREHLEDILFTVHTMSSNHATLDKTLMLFSKHFIPMTDIDKFVEIVVNHCKTCKK